jgi:type VI secretion system secreted protein Hcp
MLAGACAAGFAAAAVAGSPAHLAAAHKATVRHAAAHPVVRAAAAAGPDAALTALTRPLTATPGDPIFMFIKNIPGESKDRGHLNWIDVSGYHTNFVGKACGDCPGAQFGPFVVTMPYSRAVPPLLGQLVSGTQLPTVELQAAATTAKGTELNFLTITLSQVVVSSLAEASGGGRPSETLTLQAGQLAVSYTTGSGSPEKFCYNFTNQKAC